MQTILGLLIIFGLPALYLWLQRRAIREYDGAWRIAGAAPLLVMGLAFAWSLIALAGQSNLWPMPLILAAPLCLAFLVILSLIRLAVKREF